MLKDNSRGKFAALGALFLLVLLAAGCGRDKKASLGLHLEPFNFQVSSGLNQYQIEGYFARSAQPGRLPGLLILNGNRGGAKRCISDYGHLTSIGIHVACISIPGYGKSSGPGRFVGHQAVTAARRALDLLEARPDVDPVRLGVWGLANGAVAAGLIMDSDPNLRAVVLQSGAYDMENFFPRAPLMTKLSILHQVWPSKRVLKERSVIAHLPSKLGCSVLILHGGKDKRMPIVQAKTLERALRERGAHVETRYFPRAPHQLGARVERPIQDFLRENLVALN